MKNRIYFIVGIALLVIAVGWLMLGRESQTDTEVTEEQMPEDDSIDVVMDFYSAWLSAARSTSTDPYQSGLSTSPALSESLRTHLANAGNDPEMEYDPVLCHATLPERVGTRPVYVEGKRAQVLVLPRGENMIRQAVVSLEVQDGAWLLTDIVCSDRESAPPREFSFEREGQLLKNVPPPLDPQHWHLVFEENGVMGHTAPLFFDAESICVAPDGTESVCDPSQFSQTARASVRGEMTEAGVNVKRLFQLE